MQLFFTLALALLALVAQAQKAERKTFADLPMDSTTHLVTFTGVVPVAGSTKEQLFTRAREWAARSFADNKAAVRMDDKDAGTYITRGVVKMPGYDERYDLVLAIYTKDGRYKYIIDQIAYSYTLQHSGISTKDETAESWAKLGKMNARYVNNRVKDVQEIAAKLAANIQAAMTGNVGAAKSDW